MKTKTSVICSVYNEERFLAESLDSILSQTMMPDECIIIDDGSTDRTPEIINEYKKKLPGCKHLVNSINAGLSLSRNRAILRSSGEYIAIWDGDDICLNNRIEKSYRFLRENQDVHVIGGHALKINEAGEEIGSMVYPPKTMEQGYQQFITYRLNPMIDPSTMHRRASFVKLGGYTLEKEYETVLDLDLWCRMMIAGLRFANLQEFLVKYRINSQSITNTRQEEMRRATGLVWGRLRQRNFPSHILDIREVITKDSPSSQTNL